MARVLLGLGSNVGDREGQIRRAVEALGQLPKTALIKKSSSLETEPFGVKTQGRFLNAAALLETSLSPEELLAACQQIERVLGRQPRERWGPREIDLDILLYGDQVIRSAGLMVPHPYFAMRSFALEPAAEIAPEMRHPTLETTVSELAAHRRALLNEGYEMEVFSTPEQAQNWAKARRREGKRIGVVPTMGALHEGHLSLARRAKAECDVALVTIFVNPTQFGPNEDFSRYPRTLEAGLRLLEGVRVDAVFTPEPASMYPTGHATTVSVEGLTAHLCGASRPGHFCGVTTVVAKLFNITLPDRAYFGQKDAQQALTLRRMAQDLNFPLDVVICPIVREADGLAMSSRNRYLSADERRRALVLSQGLLAGKKMVEAGERDVSKITATIRRLIETGAPTRIDYIEIVSERVEPILRIEPGQLAIAAVAVLFGKTRLIDNILLMGELERGTT